MVTAFGVNYAFTDATQLHNRNLKLLLLPLTTNFMRREFAAKSWTTVATTTGHHRPRPSPAFATRRACTITIKWSWTIPSQRRHRGKRTPSTVLGPHPPHLSGRSQPSKPLLTLLSSVTQTCRYRYNRLPCTSPTLLSQFGTDRKL
jgi:hypothetical protein